MSAGLFTKAMPFIVGIGVPIGVLIAGAALPIAWELKGSVGELKAALALLQNGDQHAFDEIDKKFDSVNAKLDLVVGRAKEAETDPATLLARAGMSPSKGFGFAYVGGTFYIFPQTRDAENQLIKTGYHKEAISPVISGYVKEATGAPATVPR
jgi:hypothetical protein